MSIHCDQRTGRCSLVADGEPSPNERTAFPVEALLISAAMTKKTNDPWDQLREVALWFLNRLWLFTIGIPCLMVLTSGGIFWHARNIATTHPLRKDVLLNVAAGLFEIGIGTLILAFIAWVVAISKLQHLAKPLLKLIQQLRIDNKLTRESARKAVVFAVTLLSESNVSKSLSRDTGERRNNCPVCLLDVRDEKERCSHCNLPQAVWTDPELVKANQICDKVEQL